MANEQVVDELVVKLTMDTSQYDGADKAKNKRVDATEAKEKQADAQRTKRDKNRKKSDVDEKRAEGDRQKRLGQTEKAVKQLGSTLKVFALTTAAVFGIGAGVGGIVNAITNLAGFETGLRRQAVSTGLSNREMQAWGATAKRLGADADSGAAAIAALAREQKQFNLTGSGPTMQALARMGVNITPSTKPEDALEQAQAIYKKAPPAQQQQMEAQLSAQGVSDDLIVMIKSETDAREAYTRSVADSVEENKAAMGALNDAFTSLKQASLQLANVLAVSATPYIKQFGDWVHNLASDPHQVDGWLAKTGDALHSLKDIAVGLAKGMHDAWDVVNAIAHPIANAGKGIGNYFSKTKADFDKDDPTNQYRGHSPGLVARRILHSIGIGGNPDINPGPAADDVTAPGYDDGTGAYLPKTTPGAAGGAGAPGAPGAAGAAGGAGAPGANLVAPADFAQMLTQRGMTPAQAAAATANAAREAPGPGGTIDPSSLNSGKDHASGAFQWLGERKAAFRAQYGVDPNQAPLAQQLDFLFSNPAEIARTQKAFAGATDAKTLGTQFSAVFEAHGNKVEDIKRGQLAATLGGTSAGGDGSSSAPDAGSGTVINLNGPVTVKADDPNEFVGGIQRVAQVQNYNTATR